jgi:hypothetical protein
MLGAVGLVMAGFVVAGLVWTASGPSLGRAAALAMNVHETIDIQSEPWLSFEPEAATVGLILYPAARVQAEAYAPLARQLAERGLLVVIVDPPFRAPLLANNTPDGIVSDFPEIEVWAVGGHGFGAMMAASYLDRRPEVQALVLMGAVTPTFVDLSNRDVVAVSVVGSLDGFVSVVEIEESKGRMPSDFVIAHIDGANHAQFGDFGELVRDGTADLAAAEQRYRAADLIADALAGLGASG